MNWNSAILFALSLGLGVVFAELIKMFGEKGAAAIPLMLLGVLVIPVLGKGTFRRFRDLLGDLKWWHSLWLFVFLSALVFRLRDTQTISDSAVDSWALYRIGLMGITAFALVVRLALGQPPFSMALFRGLLGRLLVYALIGVFSTIWSAYRVWTLYKSCEYLIVVILIAAVLATIPSVIDYKRLLDFTWTLDGLLLLSIWAGVFIWPSDALQPSQGLIHVQLQGMIPLIADNGVGHLSAILAIVGLSRLLRKEQTGSGRIFYSVLSAVSVITMVLSQTRSAVLGFLFGLLLLLYFSRRIGLVACVVVSALLLLLATGAGSVFEEYMRRGQDADRVASLSGRTDWWEFGWNEFKKSPFMGMGAFTSRFTVLSKFGDQEVSTVHNTYLETALGVGIVGLLALLAVFVALWKDLVRELRMQHINPARRALALEATAVLGVITLRSFFSVGLIVHYDLDFFAILGFAELARRLPDRVVMPANTERAALRQSPAWLPVPAIGVSDD